MLPSNQSSPRRSVRVLRFFATLLTSGLLSAGAYAANPAEGTLGPEVGPKLEWDGNALGAPSGGPPEDALCEDGLNCDTFTITLTGNPADYAGKQLVIGITWGLAANDYDLYIRKDATNGDLVGEGDNGFGTNSDGAVIDPATSGTGKYLVRVTYSSVAGPTDQFHGTATIAEAAASSGDERRAATYTTGSIAFGPNRTVKAPVTTRDGEPSIRTDFLGNTYAGGIRGVPAGVDLWFFDLNPNSPKYDPFMRVPYYRGQPDAFTPTTAADLGSDGGGDIDLAVGFAVPAGQEHPTLNFSSLVLANISTGRSRDRAETYEKNPGGNSTGGVSVDDRQWQEFLGANSVYLYYRTIAPAVTQIQRSDDGGLTFGPAATAGTTTQVGPIDVHQKTEVVYAAKSTGVVAIGKPPAPGLPPLQYTNVQAATDPNGVAHLFFVVKVADDETPNGTVYVCYSNDREILLKHSTDQGATWSKAVRVNQEPLKTNVFPWLDTGTKTGSVGIVWYGTTHPENDDGAQWKVYYAQSFNATADEPTFEIAEVTEPEHVIHGSNISEGGLTGAANRNLIDYFQLSIDPLGAAVVAYTDDHNDYDGNTFVARQIAGPSLKTGAALAPPVEGANLTLPTGTSAVETIDAFPPRQPGLNGEQVTDFETDVTNQVVNVDVPDPSDVLSARYDTSGTGDSLALAATMRVSDLSVIPAGTSWMMNFAVNAPFSVLSPDGTYSFGVSDDGDQFYFLAETNVDGDQTFTYGTAVRNPDGTLTYTEVGDADTGAFNQESNTISLQVSIAKINAVLQAAERPLIGHGSIVAGLRARSYVVEVDLPPPQASRQGRRDFTRGGTQLAIRDFALGPPAALPAATPLPPPADASGPMLPSVELANLATRVDVKTGEDVGIAGFIVRNTAPKRLLIRGIGPSLRADNAPLAGSLQDPVLEIRDDAGDLIATNDDWRSDQQAEITASGLAPTNDKEAAVIVNLTGSSKNTPYTATLSGVKEGQGIGVIEIYDINAESAADLGNISTRGQVGTGANVLIGGVIIRDDSGFNQPQDILLRAIGPSLSGANVANPLADPTLELFDAQGNSLASNDDWRGGGQETNIAATGIPPSNDKESAIRRTLAPGAYTAILSGSGGTTGVGLVEVYNLGNNQ